MSKKKTKQNKFLTASICSLIDICTYCYCLSSFFKNLYINNAEFG